MKTTELFSTIIVIVQLIISLYMSIIDDFSFYNIYSA